MKKEELNHHYSYQRQICVAILLFISCFIFRIGAAAQTLVISFPVNSTVYQGSEIPLTAIIAGVRCENTVIKCHKGLVSMIGGCQYLYRCKNAGIDTIEVLIRRGDKMHFIGQQVFEVKPRPLPQANIAGLIGGRIVKGDLQAQQGVGAEFYVAGNHWEHCTIERFDIQILRSGKVVTSNRNEGNLFTAETKTVLQQLQPGDTVLVTNIIGCLQQGGGELKTLEFTIE